MKTRLSLILFLLPALLLGQNRLKDKTTAATIATDDYFYLDGATNGVRKFGPSANVKTLLAAADYAAFRTSLGLVIGTNVQAYDADLTTYAGITPSANVQTLLGAANFSAFRTSLGVAIGTDVQAYDADLTTYAGITPSSNVQTLLGAANYAAFKSSLSLNNVENTALSTWTGSSNIATVASDLNILRPNTSSLGTSGAVTIDVTKRYNRQTLAGATTWSLSATPTAGTTFGVLLTGDGTARTVTLPAGTWYSMALKATRTTFTTEPTSSTYEISVRYDGTTYYLAGEPVAISDLTADASPDGAADYVETYDASAGTSKKVLLNNLPAASATVSDTAFASSWNAVTSTAPSKNAVYDQLHLMDTDDDGKVDILDNIAAAGFPYSNSSGAVQGVRSITGTANQITVTNGDGASGAPTISIPSSAVLPGSPTVSGTASTAAGGIATIDGTQTFTGKTFDAAGTGNVLKAKGYIYLTHPHLADGTGATIGTTATSLDYGHATFSNSAAASGNYVEYYFQVPEDLNTSVDLRARLKVRLAGADTAAQRYVISSVSVADSAVPTSATLANAINIDFAGDASGASGDVETSSWTTLTSWKGALTAGQTWRIRLARDGSASPQDASTVNSTECGLVIEYGMTQ